MPSQIRRFDSCILLRKINAMYFNCRLPVLETGVCRFKPCHRDKQNPNTMANTEKKRKKLRERIEELNKELISALTKKTSNVKEINVASHTLRIRTLEKELEKL